MRKRLRAALLAFVAALATAAPPGAAEPPAPVAREVDPATAVVVLVNEALPESVALGEYYAAKRGIPASQICRVKTRTDESCSWPELRKDLLEPLRAFLAKRPDVLFLVPTYGIPVKTSEENPENDGKGGPGGPITQCVLGRDYCAVDRELELLNLDHPLDGWFESKLFNQDRHVTLADRVYVVSRLDGPTPEAARALVDNALYGEAYGVEGKSFLDTRGRTDPAEAYGSIDIEMKNVTKVYEKYGLAFDHDDREEVVDLATLADPAHYWGWYTGDVVCSKEGWRFHRGAVGAHLHSFSAVELRRKDRAWTGPLIAHGVTGTCGTVYEPLSAGFPFGTIFLDRFLHGYTFGESMVMSSMFTSWAAVFVGDPLYAPYAAGRKEAQEKNREVARRSYADLAAALDGGDVAKAQELAKAMDAIGVAYAGAEDTTFLVDETRARAAWPDRKAKGNVADLRKAVEAARAAVEAGDFRRGSAEAKQALRVSPANTEANLLAGRCALESGDPKGGLAALEVAVRVQRSFESDYWTGLALRVLGRRKEALAAFESALERRFDLGATRQVGELLLEQKNFAEAVARLERVRERHPADRELAGELGRAYVAVKDWKKAIAVLDGVLKELPATWPEAEAYVASCERLLEALKGEGSDKVRMQALTAMTRGFRAGKVPATPRSRATAVERRVDEAAVTASVEKLAELPAYEGHSGGLPRLRLTNRSPNEVQVLLSGPVAFGTTLGTAPPKNGPPPLELDLVPGTYRIAVLTTQGGKRRVLYREQRIELDRGYALALDDKGKLFLPPRQ